MKTQSRFTIKSLTSTTVFSLVLSLTTPLVASAQQTIAATPDAEVSAAALECTNSPFGNQLLVGAEREIFVSYRGGSAPYQHGLAAVRLDLTNEGKLQPEQTWLEGNSDASLANVSEATATLADLNADGKVELIQALRDASEHTQLVAHSNSFGLDSWMAITGGDQEFVAASGNLVRSAEEQEATVVAYRNPGLSILLMNSIAGGGFPGDFVAPGLWSSNQNFRNSPHLLSVATGDLDGDGFDDEIVIAFREGMGDHLQLIVLEYTPGHEQGSSPNFQKNLKELATLRIQADRLLNLHVAAADIDGDYKDEIVLAFDEERPSNDNYSQKITVFTFDFSMPAQGALITQLGKWENPNVSNPNLALATADSDGDGIAEVIVAYEDAPDGLTVVSLDAEVAQIVGHNQWQDLENFRRQVRELSIDAADLDRDGMAEIITAFRDEGNLLQTVRINDSISATLSSTISITGTHGMTLVDAWRNGNEGRAGATNIDVRLGDWDNDSLKAQYAPAVGGSLKCKQVVEPQITSAIFVPPFWQQIQDGQYIFASVGKTESKEKSNETALTSSYSHSASGYFGVGVGVEGGLGSFESSVKLTAGYEYAASQTRSGSTSQGQSISVGWTNFSSFLVVDDTTYNCYSYQMMQNGVPVDGMARFCENKGLKNRSLSLDAWDMREDIDLQYAPVARDWSSLTRFRGFYTSQSSTDGGAAALAADSNTDGTLANGSVMRTQNENAPWWQIDLGSVQEISQVRVWNRNNVGCTVSSCMNQLSNFHVFITDSDPGAISNDPSVLKNAPGVTSIFHAGVGGRVTTLRTLDANFEPLRGRYVRVQLAGPGVLSLAEVQVFAGNHVEPDRYPVSVNDPDGKTDPNTGKYIPGKDGWFNVIVFNSETGQYESLRTRGNLLWTGSNYDVLKNQQIGDGESTLTWSLGTTSGGSSSESTSTSHTVKVGAEFDVEVGIAPVKVQTGGSYEFGTGFGKEETQSLSWEKSFEMDGGVQGFPRLVNGQAVQWPGQCRYGFQPYYYELSDESNIGYSHKFLVLDYIVPQHLLSRDVNLDPCRQGSYKTGNNRAPQVNPNSVVAMSGASLLVDVIANAQDPDNDKLSITSVGGASHGIAKIVENRILYTPTVGYTGEDSFSYTLSDGFGGEVTALVTVVVGGAPGAQSVYLPLVAR